MDRSCHEYSPEYAPMSMIFNNEITNTFKKFAHTFKQIF